MQIRTLKVLSRCGLFAALALGSTVAIRATGNQHELVTACLAMLAAGMVPIVGMIEDAIRSRGSK